MSSSVLSDHLEDELGGPGLIPARISEKLRYFVHPAVSLRLNKWWIQQTNSIKLSNLLKLCQFFTHAHSHITRAMADMNSCLGLQ